MITKKHGAFTFYIRDYIYLAPQPPDQQPVNPQPKEEPMTIPMKTDPGQLNPNLKLTLSFFDVWIGRATQMVEKMGFHFWAFSTIKSPLGLRLQCRLIKDMDNGKKAEATVLMKSGETLEDFCDRLSYVSKEMDGHARNVGADFLRSSPRDFSEVGEGNYTSVPWSHFLNSLEL